MFSHCSCKTCVVGWIDFFSGERAVRCWSVQASAHPASPGRKHSGGHVPRLSPGPFSILSQMRVSYSDCDCSFTGQQRLVEKGAVPCDWLIDVESVVLPGTRVALDPAVCSLSNYSFRIDTPGGLSLLPPWPWARKLMSFSLL